MKLATVSRDEICLDLVEWKRRSYEDTVYHVHHGWDSAVTVSIVKVCY